MKVCIIRNAQAESNASMIRVVDALIYGGYEVVLLSRNRENTFEEEKVVRKKLNYKNHNIENYEIQLPSKRGNGKKNIANLISYMKLVYRWLKKNTDKYDYIHSFDLDTGIPAQLIAKIYNKKLIYHIADFYVDSRGGIPNRLEGTIKNIEYSIINRANLTIVCTEERKKQISGSKPNKLIVIHNTPVNEFNRESIKRNNFVTNTNYDHLESKLHISYVGGLSESRFIEEILKIVSNDSRLYLDIAGYGNLSKQVKEYSEKFANIEYHGQIDYSKSLKLNSQSDLMIAMYDPQLKNNQFSAPNKIYEAMYFGKPIIVAEGTGVDKLVLREKIGLVSNYSMQSFKKTINYVLDNPKLLNQYSASAKKVYTNYSWNKMRHRLVDEYRDI